MNIPADLDGARLNVSRTAELVGMNSGHFRRLVRKGVFPTPKRTSKGMPYFDHDLLVQVGQVLKSGVGVSGEEISFYRRKKKSPTKARKQQSPPESNNDDEYVHAIIEGCKQLGVDQGQLSGDEINAALRLEFGDSRPALNEAIPTIARRFLAGE